MALKKADITSEPIITNKYDVLNKNKQMNYVWVLKNDDEQMAQAYENGYVPATGNEKIMRNPFESAKDVEGSQKIRGTGSVERILLCCPKHLKVEREKERASRYVKADKAGKAESKKMMDDGGSGFTVESEATEETKVESVKE